jgi:NTP pyrophosphatase (non-canonical NTP hydrolase)
MERKGLTLNQYQERAMTTCMGTSDNMCYMLMGLCEEVGELQGKFSKAVRKGLLEANHHNQFVPTEGNRGKLDELREAIKAEAGDVAWMFAGFCKVMGWSLEEVCQGNLDKLAARKAIGTIDGNGDGIERGK